MALLVAMDENGGIGLANGLPWRLPDDLKRFKQLTLGHHILMGRKTWLSIGRPLPGRVNLVLSRSRAFQAAGGQVVHDLQQALAEARQAAETELFIIGGAEIFALALPLADRLYLTRVHTVAEADAFFPELDFSAWRRTAAEFHPEDARHASGFTFEIWERSGDHQGA